MQVEYELTNIEGIGESAKVKLIEAGITSVAQLAALTPEELSRIKGFGLATSRRIIESAHELNKQYLHSKWNPAWQAHVEGEVYKTPFNNPSIPMDYTTYDLHFVRTKNLGF